MNELEIEEGNVEFFMSDKIKVAHSHKRLDEFKGLTGNEADDDGFAHRQCASTPYGTRVCVYAAAEHM